MIGTKLAHYEITIIVTSGRVAWATCIKPPTRNCLVDSKETAPNEIRAKSSQGGQTHHLTKGDVITIPANTPHWFKEIPTQTIAYYAVNIEN